LICNKYGVAYKDVDDLCQHQLSVIDLEYKGPSKAFQKLIKQKKKSLNQTSKRDNKKPNLIEAVLNDDLSVEIESAQDKKKEIDLLKGVEVRFSIDLEDESPLDLNKFNINNDPLTNSSTIDSPRSEFPIALDYIQKITSRKPSSVPKHKQHLLQDKEKMVRFGGKYISILEPIDEKEC